MGQHCIASTTLCPLVEDGPYRSTDASWRRCLPSRSLHLRAPKPVNETTLQGRTHIFTVVKNQPLRRRDVRFYEKKATTIQMSGAPCAEAEYQHALQRPLH